VQSRARVKTLSILARVVRLSVRGAHVAKRMAVMLTVTTVLVAALGFVKFKQIQTAVGQAAAFQPPPDAVSTIVAAEESWPSTLAAIGTVAAVQGVTVSADLPGTVERIGFDSGRSVREGEVLAILDTRQEQAQLAAAESQRELARLNFERMQGLVDEHVVSRAEFDRANADYRQSDARVGEIKATIERKTVRAPFSGLLGLRRVNLGQYLSAGDPLVTLESLNPIYVNFGIPQQAMADVRPGRAVRVTAADMTGTEFVGRVTAIDSVVDESTRNVKTQATLGAPSRVIALPASAISYAPYGDSVFVVADLTGPNGKTYRGVRQQFVKV